MNVSSRIALTREMKRFGVTFLSTDDPWLSGLKYQILKYFDDWFTKIEVRLSVYEKLETKNVYIITNL